MTGAEGLENSDVFFLLLESRFKGWFKLQILFFTFWWFEFCLNHASDPFCSGYLGDRISLLF
jgi:hypothetical protein